MVLTHLRQYVILQQESIKHLKYLMSQKPEQNNPAPDTKPVHLPADLVRMLKIEAAKRDTSIRQFVEDALREHLKVAGKKSAA